MQFEGALSIGQGSSTVARAAEIARDVAFFFLEMDDKDPLERPQEHDL